MRSAVDGALSLQRTVGNHAVERQLTGMRGGGGAATLQRKPDARDPAAERDAAARKALADMCTNDQIEAQSEAEDKLKLEWKKRAVKDYAWKVGGKDRDRIRKRGQVSSELQQELIVKIRFFEDAAKPAYLQTIGPTLAEFAEPAQVIDITNAPRCASVTAKDATKEPTTRGDIPCDIGQREFLLIDESDPASTRCMKIDKDPEYQKLFDSNIVRAVAFAIPDTTWENVEYDRFRVMQVFYRNGKSEYFMLNEVGNFYYGRAGLSLRDHVYVKRATGMIYPVQQGGIYFNELLTPNIISLKNGLKYQAKELKDLYNLLQVAGSFANILGLYGLGVESFKASISAFRRTGPARLPGRPLPGIGVKPSPRARAEKAFGELDGVGRGFKIQVVDDSTVHETPTSRSNVGLATKYAGGAETNLVTKQIFVHQDLVNANGITRKWGTSLDLKQVLAHELGHGINGGGPCALASRTGADLPGLSSVQRIGLLNDAVHISRASSQASERVTIQQLRLPNDFKPPER